MVERSSPRGVRKSISSTVASWRSLAALSRNARRRLSRASASRSTNRPKRSSKLKPTYWLDSSCSRRPSAMPSNQRVELVEGLGHQHRSGLQQAVLVVRRPAEVGVLDRHDLEPLRLVGDRHLVEASLQNGIYAAIRSAADG